ncbi:hypothetical protein [Mycolicibacterium boenickei]|uniref:ATPase n=1 Tax=Mycolicibacterium boenickei TaxID=146017 RepID=A0ABN5ZKN3_9MYCO|nr:hypothetical protein [Mycolicibacterium boenickei]BBX94690.1 hypothetical protein MBOE_63390 [Mycolicibacterium boenickei]
MSTAADRIRANATRIKTQAPQAPLTTADPAPEAPAPAQATTPAEPAPAPVNRPVVRQKSIRRTVDLTPAQHRALDVWQRETADNLGLARVTGQDVLAALVDQLLASPELGAQITRTIQARQ